MNEQLIMKRIAKKIKNIGLELGFNHIGISDLNLDHAKKPYQNWIDSNFQGDMSYLKNGIYILKTTTVNDGKCINHKVIKN